ncbi:Replication factor-A carboxy-terminal domain protein [Arachis hypogaea]|nr:Replication factor-A carboxy-terminal domain protein [Arachis hypogaea]
MRWMPLSVRRRDVGSAAERATPDVGVPLRPTRIHDDACSLEFRCSGSLILARLRRLVSVCAVAEMDFAAEQSTRVTDAYCMLSQPLSRAIYMVLTMPLASHRIRCALFGEYVDELNRFLSSEYAEQPVVVLQLAKVKVFRGLYHVNFTSGRVGLQNVMFASKLEFNLDIPEVVAFRKSSIPHGVSTSQPIGIVRSEKNIGIEEDFMKLTPKCTVKSLDDNNQAEIFVVLAKIAEIVEDDPWWYSACVCGKGVQAESGIYFCQFCNIHITNVLVEDSTGVSIFVLFDREASYLLNKTCAQLFEQHLKDVDVVFGTQSPPIFQEIVGKTMLFKVLSRPVGMKKFKGTYPVRRVCDDAAIVGMFELSGSDLSPKKRGIIWEPSKITKSSNLGLTPSSCSELFAGSPQCTQKESSVVDLGADEDAKCLLLKRKSADAVVDKLNEVDSSENSCDEVDESEEEYVVGVNRVSVDAEKDVKPSLKRLRRSLKLQFDEADKSCGSGNDGSSGHGVN